MRLETLTNILNQKIKGKKEKSTKLLKTEIDFLNEGKRF